MPFNFTQWVKLKLCMIRVPFDEVECRSFWALSFAKIVNLRSRFRLHVSWEHCENRSTWSCTNHMSCFIPLLICRHESHDAVVVNCVLIGRLLMTPRWPWLLGNHTWLFTEHRSIGTISTRVAGILLKLYDTDVTWFEFITANDFTSWSKRNKCHSTEAIIKKIEGKRI